MVAYSFKARFAEPIAAGLKRHTIRAERKRHARPGEAPQLYTGMRTRSCRLIGLATCTAVFPIRLDLECGRVETETGRALTTPEEMNAFAVSDGFADWRDLRRFWEVNHPGIDVFSGVLIAWGETFSLPTPPLRADDGLTVAA